MSRQKLLPEDVTCEFSLGNMNKNSDKKGNDLTLPIIGTDTKDENGIGYDSTAMAGNTNDAVFVAEGNTETAGSTFWALKTFYQPLDRTRDWVALLLGVALMVVSFYLSKDRDPMKFVASFIALQGVILLTLNNISGWWLSLVSNTMFIYLGVSTGSDEVGMTVLNIFYVVFTCYGIWEWRYGGAALNAGEEEKPVSYVKPIEWIFIVAFLISYVPFHYFVFWKLYNPAECTDMGRFADALGVALIVLGTILMGKRYVECNQFLLWANLLFIVLYYGHDESEYMCMFIGYLIATVYGLYNYADEYVREQEKVQLELRTLRAQVALDKESRKKKKELKQAALKLQLQADSSSTNISMNNNNSNNNGGNSVTNSVVNGSNSASNSASNSFSVAGSNNIVTSVTTGNNKVVVLDQSNSLNNSTNVSLVGSNSMNNSMSATSPTGKVVDRVQRLERANSGTNLARFMGGDVETGADGNIKAFIAGGGNSNGMKFEIPKPKNKAPGPAPAGINRAVGFDTTETPIEIMQETAPPATASTFGDVTSIDDFKSRLSHGAHTTNLLNRFNLEGTSTMALLSEWDKREDIISDLVPFSTMETTKFVSNLESKATMDHEFLLSAIPQTEQALPVVSTIDEEEENLEK